MSLKIAALILLGAALVLPQMAEAQSAVCAEPGFTAALEHAALPLPVQRDEDLPWCASPEDPRCAPLDTHSAPASLGLRQALAVVAAEPETTPFITDDDSLFSPRTGLLPCAGVNSRIERPPR